MTLIGREISGNRQLPAFVRRLFQRVHETVKINCNVEVGRAVLPGAYRLSEQGVHLPDVEGVALREVRRYVNVAARQF